MKFFYIANVRIPTEKAHGLAIMKMCEAFAKENINIVLVVPRRLNNLKENPFDYYGVGKVFNIKKIPVLDLIPWFGKLGFLIEAISFAKISFLYSIFNKADIYYGRDELTLSLLSLFKKNVAWESHTAKNSFWVRILLKRCKKLVVISNGLKEYYMSLGVPIEKILVAPSGVDVKSFSLDISKEESREKVGLPQNKTIILYTGHLYSWKGVDTLAEASSNFDDNTIFIFVGGTDKDVLNFKNNYKNKNNILVLGQKRNSEIPYYLKSANLLVLPNSGKEDISRKYTSPMKLFEYMASGIPIVTSNLPSIREIVDESMVYFFEPDNAEDLSKTIKRALLETEGSIEMTNNAYNLISNYSWENRAKNILEFI